MLQRVSEAWIETSLPGVLHRQSEVRLDDRGAFFELWRHSWTESLAPRFVQANLSRSDAGVLRGLHFHLRQTDLWMVLEGRAHVCLVDLRSRLTAASPAGPHAPLGHAAVLGPSQAVLIPEGVAHGFWALEPVSLLYLVTNEYDGTDEHGFAWNDPDAGATWPGADPVLSDRDASAPTLVEAVEIVQRSGQTMSR
jgi:dTDP-4-dehydrorhamnose 3,5-epimerase